MLKKEFNVANLHCAGCANSIQGAIEKMNIVSECVVDFYSKKIVVTLNSEIEEDKFLKKLNFIADKIEPGTVITSINEKIEEEADINESEIYNKNSFLSALFNKENSFLVVGIILFIASFFIPKEFSNFKILLLLLVYFIVGKEIIFSSIKNIKKGNFLDENFLMTIATFGALILGEFSEAAGVMIFYQIGEFFQDYAVDSSKKSISNLLNLKPQKANILDKDGNLIEVSPDSVKIGEILYVKTGEKVPLDGQLISESAVLDMSALTGESIPVDLTKGESVISGAINSGSLINVKVESVFADSTVSKIIDMVQNSSLKKAVTEKFISKFARYYTPIVVIIAILIATAVPFFLGDFKLWFSRALIFLVISCPCALVLSIPLTFFSSIGVSSRKGILIKGGNYLEKLNSIDSVVFDKTGTLTKGKFTIHKLNTNNISEDELMELAKAGEFYSNHPIAKVISSSSKGNLDSKEISSHAETAGKGIMTVYKNDEIHVGNLKYMTELGITVPPADPFFTTTYISKNKSYVGSILLADELKKDSLETVTELKKLGMNVYMLTGDNKEIGKKIGLELGIPEENIYCNLLPGDKNSIMENIQKNSKKGSIFIGDGINDAPVLALSDVGFAMGKIGSDVAVEAADVVIMGDEPSKILDILKIAKANKRTLWENIVLALGIKLLVMILGVLGFANMWFAIFADVGVSILAVLNASKILRQK